MTYLNDCYAKCNEVKFHRGICKQVQDGLERPNGPDRVNGLNGLGPLVRLKLENFRLPGVVLRTTELCTDISAALV